MSFKQIIGQDRPIRILQNAIATNRIAHAYLFEGPPSVGKVFTALNFAKAVNCLTRPENGVDCCDECASCRKIDAANHIDVSWLNLAKGKSQISIEQIRQMQAQINLKPYEARYKVFCIPDAELMNEEAQNCLLKTLEEPPLKSIIVLTSSKPAILFATIVSRCQAVKFSALKAECIRDILIKRHNIKSDAAYFLAHITQSGLIDASLYAAEDVLERKNGIIDEFSGFLNRPDTELVFLKEKESDEDILWILLVLMWWYRDMLILKETQAPDMLANIDRLKDLKAAAAKYTTLQLAETVNSISKTAQLLYQTNVNPKLALTVMTTDILNATSRRLPAH